MRRSTVLNLPPQLVFTELIYVAVTFFPNFGQNKNVRSARPDADGVVADSIVTQLPPGASVLKLFPLSPGSGKNKLECFPLVSFFRLIIQIWTREEQPKVSDSKDLLQTLLTNRRLI